MRIGGLAEHGSFSAPMPRLGFRAAQAMADGPAGVAGVNAEMVSEGKRLGADLAVLRFVRAAQYLGLPRQLGRWLLHYFEGALARRGRR